MTPFEKYKLFNESISKERIRELVYWANNGYRKLYDRSIEWKTRQALRIEGAGNKCEDCDEVNNLCAHHLNYDNFGNESYDDLKILCRKCHTKFHTYNLNHSHVAIGKLPIEERIKQDLFFL